MCGVRYSVLLFPAYIRHNIIGPVCQLLVLMRGWGWYKPLMWLQDTSSYDAFNFAWGKHSSSQLDIHCIVLDITCAL